MHTTTTRPAQERIAELRVNMHELYKRKQTQLMNEAEEDRLNARIEAISAEITTLQKETGR